MGWSDVKGIVSKVAPLLGGVLGGPFGAAAGQLVSTALGVDNTPEAVQEAINANPDAYIKIKEIEAQNASQLAEWQYREKVEIAQTDTERIKAMAAADGQSTRPKIALMMAKVLSFEILAFTVLCFWQPKMLESQSIWLVFGVLTGTPAGVLMKYFGELRKEQANRLQVPQVGLIQKLLKG